MSGVSPSGGGGPQKYLKQLKSMLISALVIIVAMKIILFAVAPLIPYLLLGLMLLSIIGLAVSRSRRL